MICYGKVEQIVNMQGEAEVRPPGRSQPPTGYWISVTALRKPYVPFGSPRPDAVRPGIKSMPPALTALGSSQRVKCRMAAETFPIKNIPQPLRNASLQPLIFGHVLL